MIEFIKQISLAQFEAALAMLNECVQKCPAQYWDAKIANNTFRQVAYHALFFVDFYLSPDENAFQPRELHHRGGDERQPTVSTGLPQPETLDYLAICRAKLLASVARETAQSLQAPAGFSRRKISRGELYLYNIRHVQHHTGQLSAFLRRIDPALADSPDLPWVGTGWH